MESYLIRIYRRDKENPEGVIGIIEEIGAEKKEPFRNLSELGKIICPAIKKGRKRHEKRK